MYKLAVKESLDRKLKKLKKKDREILILGVKCLPRAMQRLFHWGKAYFTGTCAVKP